MIAHGSSLKMSIGGLSKTRTQSDAAATKNFMEKKAEVHASAAAETVFTCANGGWKCKNEKSTKSVCSYRSWWDWLQHRYESVFSMHVTLPHPA